MSRRPKTFCMVALVALAASLVAMPRVAESQALCEGRLVTVDLGLGQMPTNGDDVILGTNGPDTIVALGGDDVVCGLGGHDMILGHLGNDLIFGGDGNDRIFGQGGNDVLYGENGNDQIFSGAGSDKLYGGAGNDQAFGDEGNDEIFGEAGDDDLAGNGGDDLILGGAGEDNSFGHGGDDEIFGGADDDRIFGQDGADDLQGDGGDDLILGGAGPDEISGQEGNDLIFGQSGDDEISGQAGNDDLRGGDGDDLVTGGVGNDQLRGGNDDDTLIRDDNDIAVLGGAGDDTTLFETGVDPVRCISYQHGKGGSGSGTWTNPDGIVSVYPAGNGTGWGGLQWEYDSAARLSEVVSSIEDRLDAAGCTRVVLHGFSNGASATAAVLCSGETFGGRLVGVVIDDPVADAATVGCSPATANVALYWTGALAWAGPGTNCVQFDWTCAGETVRGIDVFAADLGVSVTQSPHTSHRWNFSTDLPFIWLG